MTAAHQPVLVDDVCRALAPADGEVMLDATFGAGGYAKALLACAQIKLFAIDRDPAAIAGGQDLAEAYPGRLIPIQGRYSEMEALLAAHDTTAIDGVAFDVGVSSMQLEMAERGFSFQSDGPLDMRMDSSVGETAANLVNTASQAQLEQILRDYGEEPRARRIAKAIVAERETASIERTGHLAGIVERAAPAKGKAKIHPATRTFQALRIAVNDELGELKRGLAAAERLLRPAGRLAVVAFHSLEDRIVKTFLTERAGRQPAGSRHRPEDPTERRPASFRLPRKKAIKPSEAEIAANPRARSARLRVAVRTGAPAWGGVA